MSVFEELAGEYDLWYERPFGRSAFELELECLRGLLGGFDRGLEVGVGTGRFASALGVRFGVDPSLGMLRIARGRGVVCVQGVGESLPFKEESFDLVLLVVTICFVEDPVRVVAECRRVLRGGGKLVLGLVPGESPWAEFYREKASRGHPIYRHARFYTFEEVRNILSGAGFRLERVRSTLFEEPQDTGPVKNREVREGYFPEAGFTCLRAVRRSP